MFNENTFREPSTPIKPFQTDLTPAQYKFISMIMPAEYALEIIVKPVHKEPPTPSLTKAQSANPRKRSLTQQIPFEASPVKKTLSNKSETTSVASTPIEMPPVKKQVKIDAPQMKKTASVPVEKKAIPEPQMPTTSSKPLKPVNENMKNCFTILQKIKSHTSSMPFIYTVNPALLGMPDFHKRVDNVDLNIVESKLKNGEYANPADFNADVRKIWFNAKNSNAPGSELFQKAAEMSSLFEKLLKPAEPALLPPPAQEPGIVEERLKKMQKQMADIHQKGGMGGMLTMVDSKPKFPILKEVAMTHAEKKTLYQNINKLKPQSLKGVWDIVSEDPSPLQKNKDIIEFDLDTLSVEVSRKLERYVNFHVNLLERNEQKEKVPEPFRNSMAPYPMMGQKAVKLDSGKREMKPVHGSTEPSFGLGGLDYFGDFTL